MTRCSAAWTLSLVLAPTLAAQAATTRPKPAAPPTMMALLVVENLWSKEDGVCRERQLVRYRMKEGHLLPREIILKSDQRFFSHFGGHRIVANRYVVTKYAGVLDLETKKVIHDESDGTVLEADGDCVVFSIQNSNRESGVFVFDMKMHKVRKLKDPGVHRLLGVIAPDRKRTAGIDHAGNLWIHPVVGRRTKIADGFFCRLSMLSSGMPSLRPFWLDDKTILTQRNNGQLVTVDVMGKTTPLLTIDKVKDPIGSPSFERDPAGRLVYWCEDYWVIDVAKRTATKTAWRALGHGFDAEIRIDKKYGRIVRQNGKEIGRMPCLPWAARTAPNLLAIPFAKAKSLGYPKGVKIWDAPRKQWKTIRVSVNSVIGWVKG